MPRDLDGLANNLGAVSIEPRSYGLPAVVDTGRSAMAITLLGMIALIAGVAPLHVSMLAVFLFAGPHNWLELRYFLARMPARWGRLTPYFAMALCGVAFLSAAYISLAILIRSGSLSADAATIANALWNSLVVAWVVLLIEMRGRQNPRRNWPWTIPIGFAAMAATWISPAAWSTALTFLHPCVGLWFLDRELARRRSPWSGAYRRALATFPLWLLLMVLLTPVTVESHPHAAVTERIEQQAGVGVVPFLPGSTIVAIHVCLELLHYLVWIVLIPWLTMHESLLSLRSIPLVRRSAGWGRLLSAGLIMAMLAVGVLWGAFLVDYATVRDLYFVMAIGHVLAEIPFLLRLL